MTTINKTISHGITIGATYSSPLTITAAGYVGGITSNSVATVVNAGRISGGNPSSGAGVTLAAGGSVTNQAGGVISGGRYGILTDAESTVVNAGSIGGNATSGIGVFLEAGSSVTNQAGGTISGGADAVKFLGGNTGRLVIDPGAVFVGTVDGGNTISAATLSTLELGSGTGAGTLTGLGSHYVHFGAITIDSGATWTLAADTLGTGYRIADNGTLTNTGSIGSAVTLGGGAVLTNASGAIIAGNPSSGAGVTLTAGGSVTNQAGGVISGHFGISANNVATVVNAGSIGGNATSGIGVYLEAGGSVSNQAGGTISGSFGIAVEREATIAALGAAFSRLPTSKRVRCSAPVTGNSLTDTFVYVETQDVSQQHLEGVIVDGERDDDGEWLLNEQFTVFTTEEKLIRVSGWGRHVEVQ